MAKSAFYNQDAMCHQLLHWPNREVKFPLLLLLILPQTLEREHYVLINPALPIDYIFLIDNWWGIGDYPEKLFSQVYGSKSIV